MKCNKKLLLLLVTAIILLVYTFIEPYWITVKTIPIINKDIPSAFNNKKIIFISDIHHGPFLSIERVQNLVKKINSLEPDIVLLGGDYVHRDKKYIKPVFRALSRLKANLFIGGVLGNHDHWESKALTIQHMKQAGITLLDNKSQWIRINNEKIKIGGVGDLWEDVQILKNTTHDVTKKDFVLLVSHNSDYFTTIKTHSIDLVLSGHSHGGQVTLFGLWVPILPIKNTKYWKGLYKNKYSTLYITTGIGTITPPVRFFSRPEIVVFLLKTNN